MFIDTVGEHIDQIKIVDIGAMLLGCDASPMFDMYEMAKHPKAELFAFEPQESERVKVEAKYADRNVTILPHIIADGTTRVFYETKAGLVSGLFPLDQKMGRKFDYPEEAYELKSADPIDTVRLDDIPELQDADYLKIDTEGAEGMIIANGQKVLSQALLVEIEVNLLPNQVGGSAYWEIGQMMQELGFVIHQFRPLRVLNFKPWVMPRGISQEHAADAVFVRDFNKTETMSARDLLATAILLQDLYKSSDIASFFIQQHDQCADTTLFGTHSDFLAGR